MNALVNVVKRIVMRIFSAVVWVFTLTRSIVLNFIFIVLFVGFI